ncbi:MAG: amidohydrolase [Gammaproteobacteria bacterium]|jgi:predicted amidohydrolase YtcJ|nr:amidohydrolase [Gammaproteobacteria bacterium]MBT5603690.1 amidohydrolase [Gammaproteobacteria bacterium]
MMQKFRMLGCWLILFASIGCSKPESADLLLISAAVYTLDPDHPWAEAVAIRDGTIVAVGSNKEITNKFEGPIEALDGRMVLPGFHDAHLHLLGGGIQLLQCDLSGLASVPVLLAKVRTCDAALAPGEWLLGGGWNLSLFERANPSKALLDAINSERPIYLRGEDGHSSWANSPALTLAGIGLTTPDPAQGVIERDAAGLPSGTLRESAQMLLERTLPELPAEKHLEATRMALRLANSFGITSMIDASSAANEIRAYQYLLDQNELTARMVLSLPVLASIGDTMDGDKIRPDDRDSGKRLRLDAAKIFVDGVLEGETAALLEPYIGSGGERGMLLIDPDELKALVTDLDARGIQIMFHAIGDMATRVSLDAVAYARNKNGSGDNRHHIAHLQLIDEADRGRFAELEVGANFQALWAYPDGYITDINLPAVGAGRVNEMYPLASLASSGATLVGGSDWSVTSLNPLEAIETAVTRADESGVVTGVLNLNESMSLADMIKVYTLNGAFIMHQEDQVGSIEINKWADLVILEKNLFEIPVSAVGDVQVYKTLLQGEVVYQR